MFKSSLQSLVITTTLVLSNAILGMESVLADQRDFTVYNKSQVAIKHLYVSPSGASNWEEDVLGKDTLSQGESTLIYFTDKNSTCRYDIRAEFDDGEAVEEYKLNLCNINSYTFYDKK